MAEKLLFEATLKDNVSSQSDKIGDSFGGLAKKAGLAALAFVSVEKAMSFLGDAYKSAKESEIAQSKLAQALGKTSKALGDQAKNLSMVTRFEDDAITSAQSLLANYVKSESAIKALTPAILDMAEATGVDLNTAAMQVAKAVADDSEELAKYKIKIDGAAGSNERAASIIDGLNKKFGGQAQEISKAAGEVDQLKKAFGEWAEDIGKKIAPAIDSVAKKIRETLFASENEIKIKELTAAMEDFQRQSRWEEADKIKMQIEAIGKAAETVAPVVADLGLGEGKSGDADAKKARSEMLVSVNEKNAEISAANDTALLERVQKEYQTETEINQVYEEGMAKNLAIANDVAEKKKAILDKSVADEKAALAEIDAAAKAEMQMRYNVAGGAVNAAGMVVQSLSDIAKASNASAKEQQGLAMAQAAINGASAVVSIWSQAGQLGPIAGPIVAGIETAAIIAMTAAQMATISQQKFADGGIIAGPSRGDSVQVRANGGEMMLNREQQANLFAMAKGGAGGSGPSIMIAPTVKVDSGMSASEKRRIINATANTTRDALKQLSRTNRLPAGVVFA